MCGGGWKCCVYVVWEWAEVCVLCRGGDILMGDITGLGIIITLWECQDIHMTMIHGTLSEIYNIHQCSNILMLR